MLLLRYNYAITMLCYYTITRATIEAYYSFSKVCSFWELKTFAQKLIWRKAELLATGRNTPWPT